MGEAFHSVSNIVAGDGIDVDTTDPHNPVVSATGGGGGGVQSITGGPSVLIDSTDPANPVVSLGGMEPPVIIVDAEGESSAVFVYGSESDFMYVDGLAHVAQLSSGSTLDIIAGTTLTLGPPTDDQAVLTIHSDTRVAFSSDQPIKMPITSNIGDFAAAAWEGCMIYDVTNHVMVYSNGTDWIEMNA